MEHIDKSFPGVQALSAVEMNLYRGEVHGLLGENGAGKSTLMKILSGAYRQDSGTITLNGEPVEIQNPLEAQRLGIVTIYQEFTLVPSLTVAENVFMGREPGGRGLLDWSAIQRQTETLMWRLDIDLKPMTLVRNLSVAEQQMVEIARALSIQSQIIIMDEPTSALSEHETQRLLQIIRELTAQGISIIFITHHLEEALEICDRVTVLRDGRNVGTEPINRLSTERLIRMMVGRSASELFQRRSQHRFGDVALSVGNLNHTPDTRDPNAITLQNISFAVRRGEILGLAGLIGAGRTEIARAIFGADEVDSMDLEINGEPVTIRSPRDAIRLGLGLVPEDRKQQALFLALAVRANLSIASLSRLLRFGEFVNRPAENELIEEYRRKLSIRMATPEQRVSNLSGGNQQKVVIARWLALQPQVLIVDEPTRGIDVAAKAEVHQLLDELANQGIAVIMISSELPEILSISDRILTLRQGRITGEFLRAQASEELLMQHMALDEAVSAQVRM
ncbi:MAG: sugar ABC transporter ATP-binding protein [Chloroflexi bacterium]|nr:sugar ABC transporter ATP-binding protein [Chloroflexota bacterium]